MVVALQLLGALEDVRELRYVLDPRGRDAHPLTGQHPVSHGRHAGQPQGEVLQVMACRQAEFVAAAVLLHHVHKGSREVRRGGIAELAGLDRTRDFDYFIRNEQGIWNTLLLEPSPGNLAGFLISVNHPSSNMLGPGVMRDSSTALALIYRQLAYHTGRNPVFLIPSDQSELLKALYGWGARNCELHMHNVLGAFQPTHGIHMPTFMPETA